jgi:DNA invertase Pin-like site-specific DNA recombinase
MPLRRRDDVAKPVKSGAVIYTRVSSKDQVCNYSLDTQEQACQEFAARAGYDVVKVFTERGESAKTADRTELQTMLKYITANAGILGAVIVYKIDRLSRNVADYSDLRAQLKKNNVRLQSATESLDETPTGKYIGNLFASTAQWYIDNLADQSNKGMRAAVRAGKYIWPAPIGYRNNPGSSPSLIPDSPTNDNLVRKAWALVASGLSPFEARDQLAREGLRTHKGRVPSRHAFSAMLRCETYIGYINAFGERNQGKFEPLVDAKLFYSVQRKLSQPKGPVARPYRRIHPDFPLRRTVLCPHCGQPLTAAWSRGHGGKYGYYRCIRCGCVSFRKDRLEPEFVSHLDRLSLRPSLIVRLSRAIDAGLSEDAKADQQTVRQLDARLEEQRKRRKEIIEKSFKNVFSDDDIRQLMEDTDRAIRDMEAERGRCLQGRSVDSDTVNAGLALLDKIGSLWAESDVATRRRLRRFVFPEGTSFDGSGFGTTVLPACLQLKEEVISSKGSLVRPDAVNWNLVVAELAQLVAITQPQTRRPEHSLPCDPNPTPERLLRQAQCKEQP